MGLRKGQTNNPNGRPKGKPNRVTTDMRDVLQTVLNKEMTPIKLSNLLKKLGPKDRMHALTKMLEFSIPKLQSISVQAQIEAEYEQLERLLQRAPDEAIDKIFDRLEALKNGQEKED
nr:hypothetical protein [uncultured Draconibacterium sp.]